MRGHTAPHGSAACHPSWDLQGGGWRQQQCHLSPLTQDCLECLSDAQHGSAAHSHSNRQQSQHNCLWCGSGQPKVTPTPQEKKTGNLLPPVQKIVFKYENFLFQLHFCIAEASQTARGYQHRHQTYRTTWNTSAAGTVGALKSSASAGRVKLLAPLQAPGSEATGCKGKKMR